MKVRTTSKLLLKGIEVNSLNNKVKIYKYDDDQKALSSLSLCLI